MPMGSRRTRDSEGGSQRASGYSDGGSREGGSQRQSQYSSRGEDKDASNRRMSSDSHTSSIGRRRNSAVRRDSRASLFSNISDPIREARAQLSPKVRQLYSRASIAELHLEEAQYSQALEGLDRLMKDSAAKEDSTFLPKCMRMLLRCYFMQSQDKGEYPQEAIARAEEALSNYREDKDQYGEAMVLLCKAEMIAFEGSGDAVLTCLEWSAKAAQIFEEFGDLRLAAVAFVECGFSSVRKGDTDQVARYAIKAMRHFCKLDERGGMIHALNLLSNAYVMRQLFDTALEKATQGLEMAEWLGNNRLVNMQLDSIIMIRTSKHDYEKIVDVPENVEDYEGLWRDENGDDVAAIMGQTLMWLNGDPPCMITVERDDDDLSGVILSYWKHGEEITGELDVPETEAGDTMYAMEEVSITWDNKDVWTLFHKRQGGIRAGDRSSQDPAKDRRRRSAMYKEFIQESIKLRSKFASQKSALHLLEILETASWSIESSSLSGILDVQIASLGLTSTQLMITRELICRHFDTNLPVQIMFQVNTIGELCAWVMGFIKRPSMG